MDEPVTEWEIDDIRASMYAYLPEYAYIWRIQPPDLTQVEGDNDDYTRDGTQVHASVAPVGGLSEAEQTIADTLSDARLYTVTLPASTAITEADRIEIITLDRAAISPTMMLDIRYVSVGTHQANRRLLCQQIKSPIR